MEILEHLLDTDAVTINYTEGPPSGPPLVFLHGGSGRWQSYEGIISDLAARFPSMLQISAGTANPGGCQDDTGFRIM